LSSNFGRPVNMWSNCWLILDRFYIYKKNMKPHFLPASGTAKVMTNKAVSSCCKAWRNAGCINHGCLLNTPTSKLILPSVVTGHVWAACTNRSQSAT
jgi:hypothetical protein